MEVVGEVRARWAAAGTEDSTDRTLVTDAEDASDRCAENATYLGAKVTTGGAGAAVAEASSRSRWAVGAS